MDSSRRIAGLAPVHRRSVAGIASAALGVALLGTGIGEGRALANDSTSFGVDAMRTRATSEGSGAAFRGREWRFSLPAMPDPINQVLVSTPAVADGFVVFGTTSSEVIALGASDGQVRWRFRARDGLHASPAIVRGKVLIPSFDGNLYALRLADGQVLWTRNFGSVVFSSPAPVGDSVVVATGFPARKVVRLDAGTGEPLWETESDVMDQGSNSSVAVAADQVIVGAMAGTYYSFDLATGHLRWKYVAEGAVHLSTPLVVGGRAYFAPGGSSHSIHAVDLQTGLAVPGWPVVIPQLPADSTGGDVKARDYAVSSLAAAGNQLVFQQRLLELIDTNADTVVDTFVMREEAVAVGAGSGDVTWRSAAGRLVTKDRSAIPAFGVCPTPLVYSDAGGRTFAATLSTLTANLRVLDTAMGTEAWTKTLSAPTRSSPVLANGRLIVATDSGAVHGLLSSTNQPPLFTPRAASQPGSVPSVGAMVSWPRAVDPEGSVPTYTLRIDRDGELLTSWEHELSFTAGEISARLPFALDADATYTYAVRARDSRGAWSDWSAPQTLQVVRTPDVDVGGVPVTSVNDALAMARPGDVVRLGAGTLRLTGTMAIPPGVTLSGAGAHQTIIDGSGLDRSVSVRGSRSNPPTALDNLSVKGGRVGIAVADSDDVIIRNVVVRDTTDAGVLVEAGAGAHVINATIIRAGTAVRAAGAAHVRNSLVVENRAGLTTLPGGTLSSDFNDVNGNTRGYDGVVAGAGDLDQPVSFIDKAHDDYHLRAGQPTTDHGDPADEWSKEPTPNGGRINLGAFGNTAEAELSQPPADRTPDARHDPKPVGATSSVATTPRGAPPTPIGGAAETPPDVPSGGGGACSVAPAGQPSSPSTGVLLAAFGALVVLSRRRRPTVRDHRG